MNTLRSLGKRVETPEATVVQKVDSVIYRINHYPLDSAIGFAMTYSLDSDLSGGKRYPSFEQLGTDIDLCLRHCEQAH